MTTVICQCFQGNCLDFKSQVAVLSLYVFYEGTLFLSPKITILDHCSSPDATNYCYTLTYWLEAEDALLARICLDKLCQEQNS